MPLGRLGLSFWVPFSQKIFLSMRSNYTELVQEFYGVFLNSFVVICVHYMNLNFFTF